MFIWCICFTVTLTLFIGEFCGLRSRLPLLLETAFSAPTPYTSPSPASQRPSSWRHLHQVLVSRLRRATPGHHCHCISAVAAALYATEAFCIISSLEAWSVQASLPRPAQEVESLTGLTSLLHQQPPPVSASASHTFVVVDFICFLLEGL